MSEKSGESPKRLSDEVDENGLQVRTIQIGKPGFERIIDIHEATYLHGVRRGLNLSKTDAYKPVDDTDEEAAIAYNMLMNLWAPVTSCSEGDVPTIEQFLNLREADIEFWVNEAREVNPHWFTWLDAIEKAAENAAKKKTAQAKKDKKAEK